jgi:predicted nucleic acid-binding protein
VPIFVDTNVLLDVMTADPRWSDWSSARLTLALNSGPVGINPIIYAELASGFLAQHDLDRALPAGIDRLALPWDAAFLAGRSFLEYRRRGGTRTSPLPDFYIGAHALVSGMTLLTRDATRFRTYFPELPLIAPDA